MLRKATVVVAGIFLFAGNTVATGQDTSRRSEFDAELARLRNGSTRSGAPPTGKIESSRTSSDGVEHPYFIVVPDDYDDSRQYSVRVYLHGGVSRGKPGPGGDWWQRYERLSSPDQISVFPAGWDTSEWWHGSQVENIEAILRDLRSTYNVDENRAYMFGVSDGGSGAYFFAFKQSTTWAGFVPLIGHPSVVASPRVGADGEVYPANISNRPLLAINGETDRLYPVRTVEPFIELFQTLGTDVTLRSRPEGHTVSWWGEESPAIEGFIASHPRDPLPDSLTWETERTDKYNRFSWLVIDDLGNVQNEALSPVPSRLDPFPHQRRSGRVDLQREGNVVSVQTRGVAAFTLLISPDEFDFSRPIRVEVNGQTEFEGVVTPDPGILQKWFDIDRDRTMLFGAELRMNLR